MTAPYQAVILAAGRGSRIAEETVDRPKSCLPIGPRRLGAKETTNFLRRQCELLRDIGVEQIVIVVGYCKERIYDELAEWGPYVQTVVNPTPDIKTSGSLHSFQFAAYSNLGILDGTRQTLLLDADIVYHRDVLGRLIDSPEESALLVCRRYEQNLEEVLVFGSPEEPRFLGKGLSGGLVCDLPCLGEATGIVKFAPADHALARQSIDWMLGDPRLDETSARGAGFGPAKRATEHEELTQRFMHYRRIRAVVFGDEIPFMEVDTPEEYALLRETVYPRILEMEG
ncbi:MAG: NTP transferase domain-containing protein [Myxococcales bacterium]|nr:NTP transferase domain-containing protein [Myxococcales bacterium]